MYEKMRGLKRFQAYNLTAILWIGLQKSIKKKKRRESQWARSATDVDGVGVKMLASQVSHNKIKQKAKS